MTGVTNAPGTRTARRDRIAPRPAVALAWMAGPALGSGLAYEVALVAAGPTVALATGVAATGVLGLLAVAGRWSPAIRPAVPALLVWAALSVTGWLGGLLYGQPPVAAALRHAPVAVAFLAVNGVKLVPVALVGLLARRYRWSRTALNLRIGDPRAATGVRIGGRTVRWTLAGPLAVVAVLALFALLPPAPPLERLPRVAGWLPVFLLGAVVNACAEEFLYRHATMLALRRLATTLPAALLGSVVFGLGHLTGNPGGVAGVGYTTVFGLVCAAAMVRSRGVAWNLPVHVAGDLGVVITAALVAA